MAVVRTTDGALASVVLLTPKQAEADARERNRKAEELGITCRYVVSDE